MGIGLWMRKKGKNREFWLKLTMWLQILGKRGDYEMGRVSLLSCLSLEWDPNTFFYMPKI
jgi:hypothetical protein